jgi:hypothetical protein
MLLYSAFLWVTIYKNTHIINYPCIICKGCFIQARRKMQTQSDLYQTLKSHLSAAGEERNRRGRREFHTACPWCGKEAKRGQHHFSFSEDGGFCFVCKGGCRLHKLAALYLGADAVPVRVPQVRRAAAPKKNYAWQRDASLVGRYVSHGAASKQWAKYKPLPEATRLGYRLGFGVLPASRCKVARLVVPIFTGGKLRALRGRGVKRRECQHHDAGLCRAGRGDPVECPKWLPAAGSQTLLYNGGRLLHPERRDQGGAMRLGDAVGGLDVRGRVLFIVENPVDALLVEAFTEAAAVATLSVSYWQAGWGVALRDCGAAAIFIAFDNDVPGNGNTPAAWELWRAGGHKDIKPGGVRLFEKLTSVGVKAQLFDWSGYPAKYDIGSLVMSGDK